MAEAVVAAAEDIAEDVVVEVDSAEDEEVVVAVDVAVVITAIKMATLPENAPNKDRSATIDPLDNPWAWRSPVLKPHPRSDWKFYDQRELSILYSAANHSLSTLHNMCPLYQCIFCENLGHHMVTFMKHVFSTFIFHTTIQRVVNLFDGILQRDVK